MPSDSARLWRRVSMYVAGAVVAGLLIYLFPEDRLTRKLLIVGAGLTIAAVAWWVEQSRERSRAKDSE